MSASAPRQAQAGVALISVLLVVALVSALVYHLLERHSLVVAQSRHTLAGDQALAYAIGAEAFARQLLFEDWSNEETRAYDAATDNWAQPLAPFEVEEGYLEVWIEDLEGRFNLNALAGSEVTQVMQRFKQMLGGLELQPEVADLWRDWVDSDDQATGFGAEDYAYLVAEPPYRAANVPAAHVSELRLLHNLDPEAFAALAPHVSVLPTTELRINVNTAGAAALQAVSARLAPSTAEALAESPRRFTTVESVRAEVPELNDAGNVIAVGSRFFEVHARAEVNGARVDLASMLHRDPSTGRITLLRRDLGRRFESRFQDVDDAEAP